jgi:hypothetical protein
MKLIVYVFVMFILSKACDKKQLASKNIFEVTTKELGEPKMQADMKISYRAATRGFYLQIWIEGDSIKYTSDYALKVISIHKMPTEEKESLMQLMGDFDEKTLPELEVSSTRFQFDGAAMANLEITNGETAYKSNAFDHGKPPKSIISIVEKILSIKTMFKKQ